MARRWKIIFLALLLLPAISACSSNTGSSGSSGSNSSSGQPEAGSGKTSKTVTYQSENGPIEVPAHPQRVVVLSTFTGNAIALGVPLVGVDTWAKQNPRFQDALKNVAEVSDDNVESIIALNPDLIIGLSTAKNIDKWKAIAPTVIYTYGKLDYLAQDLEIGKLLGKEAEVRTWINDFQRRAREAGDQVRAKIGEGATVSVFENFNKELYVFGDHWGRGTEILYQEMKLSMPQKVKDMVAKDGYYQLSQEVLPEYAGDYMIFSKYADSDLSFTDTEAYRNIPAVRNNRVFEADSKQFFFNDPLTLEYQLTFFKQKFLGS